MPLFQSEQQSSEIVVIDPQAYSPLNPDLSSPHERSTTGDTKLQDVKVVRIPSTSALSQITFSIDVKSLQEKHRIRQLNEPRTRGNTSLNCLD